MTNQIIEVTNSRRRIYDAEKRKVRYQRTRLEVLRKGKEDRAECPLCGLDFRRLYIKKHIVTRHKIPDVPENFDGASLHPSVMLRFTRIAQERKCIAVVKHEDDSQTNDEPERLPE